MTKDNELYAEIKRASELREQLKIAIVALESVINQTGNIPLATHEMVLTARKALSDMMKVNGSLPRTDK